MKDERQLRAPERARTPPRPETPRAPACASKSSRSLAVQAAGLVVGLVVACVLGLALFKSADRLGIEIE